MKRIKILLVLFALSGTLGLFAQMPADGGSKLVLPTFLLKDAAIESMAVNACDYIMNKKNGFLWPVTKITFCKQAEELLVDITAIDNSWFKLFDPKEDIYGYFIVKNRMFVVASKGEEDINLDPFFTLTDSSRTFYMPTVVLASPGNPMWSYQYKDKAATFIKAENLEVLGK